MATTTVTPAAPTLKAIDAAAALGMTTREFILLVGPDGAGKSCAVVSMAWLVQHVINPAATFFVIDTESKFLTAWKSFGDQMPTNVQLFQCADMTQAVEAMAIVMQYRKANDWCAVESMARLWDRSQDLAYKAISGYDKDSYLAKRREIMKAGGGTPNPIPAPDQFWNIAKGAHDGDFLEKLDNAMSLNVIMTSTVQKPPREGKLKENEVRKSVRMEFGINVGIDGAPRLPYHAETTIITGHDPTKGMAMTCWVVRDNKSMKPPEQSRVTFDWNDKYSWATNWWATCRA